MKLKLISFLILIIFAKASFAGNHSNGADFSNEFETAVINIQEKKYLEAVKGFTALANKGCLKLNSIFLYCFFPV